jgi:putative flippase GtrA
VINQQTLKFIYTGIINTIFYYILFSVFIYIELDYKFAVLLATLIGIIFSFKTFSKYVFDNQDNKLIFKFFIIYIVLYFTNILLIAIFNLMIVNIYINGLIATLMCAILSFGLNKKFVFKKEKNVKK